MRKTEIVGAMVAVHAATRARFSVAELVGSVVEADGNAPVAGWFGEGETEIHEPKEGHRATRVDVCYLLV